MSLGKTILRPVARLGAFHAASQVRAFRSAHRRTADQQAEFLRSFVRRHAETDFAKRHGLAKVETVDEFRSAVPIQTYETLRPYVEEVLHGRTRALLPDDQPVLMFSRSSGTTGRPKHIPVTPRFLEDMRRGWNIWGLSMLYRHREAWLRPILQISSPKREADSPTGKPCGAISGLLAESQKRIVRWMYVVPRWVTNLRDPEDKYYLTLRCSIARDVAFITTANPSSTLKLIETGQVHVERLIRDIRDGTVCPPNGPLPASTRGARFRPDRLLAKRLHHAVERDGQLRPGHFWNLACINNWTGGTLGLYLKRMREVFGDVPVNDIGLVASEGRLTLPLSGQTPSGVAEITGNFLEFIPADRYDDDDPPTRLAHELETGEDYFIVMTNNTGLMRYNLDDRVRVTGFYEQSPELEFLSRGKHTASMTGEKLTEHQVVEAMNRARRATTSECERFVVQGRFADIPYYELRVDSPAVEPDALAAAMDRALCGLNIEYAAKRKSGRLGPMRAVLLPVGQFDRDEQQHIRSRNGRSEQYKHQYLLTDVIEESVTR